MSINTVELEDNDAIWERTVRDAVRGLRYGPPDDRRRNSNDRRLDRKPGGAAPSRHGETE